MRDGSKGALFGVAGTWKCWDVHVLYMWLCPERNLNFGSGAQDTINYRDIEFGSS